jgi:hypothetical protein
MSAAINKTEALDHQVEIRLQMAALKSTLFWLMEKKNEAREGSAVIRPPWIDTGVDVADLMTALLLAPSGQGSA